jgi:integrase/recombinase XerD
VKHKDTKMDYKISCSLDQRRTDKEGFYPVRLRVYCNITKSAKRYPTKFKFKELAEFEHIYKNDNLRGDNKVLHTEIHALIGLANKVAKDLSKFSFTDFERLLFNKTSTKRNVNYYYTKAVEKFKQKESISTANNYSTALKCLLRFHGKENIDFHNITISWLEQFEKFCIELEEKSLTTVSIYLRTLRTIFNDAKADKATTEDIYPFGKRKYQIPTPTNTKKALTSKQLKALFEGNTLTPEQEKAKAFWFFSYLCNGMNFKDILNVKFKNIDSEKLSFVRAKTAKTNRNSKAITVYLNDFTNKVIETYGNTNSGENDYLFPVLNQNQSAVEQHRCVKNFVRMVNQNFLKYAKLCGISESVSSYWARHSFATMAIQKGASMEFVGEAVGHSSVKTTQNYFAGFEDETKKEFSKQLLDF